MLKAEFGLQWSGELNEESMQQSGMLDSPNDLHIGWEDSVEKLNKIP